MVRGCYLKTCMAYGGVAASAKFSEFQAGAHSVLSREPACFRGCWTTAHAWWVMDSGMQLMLMRWL